MTEAHDAFDKLTTEIEQAKIACAKSYAAWSEDANKLKRLELAQRGIWNKILDDVATPPRSRANNIESRKIS